MNDTEPENSAINSFLKGLCLSVFTCILFPSNLLAQTDELEITVEQILPHLDYLSSPDREGRDDWGKIEARDYLIRQFKQAGLKPLFPDGYLQVVPMFGSSAEVPSIAGQNIGVFVQGTDPELKHEWIIVNAHYDHLGVKAGKVYPGADDNASGLAMLIEVARHVALNPCRRSVAFVAFDLEEYLLWGSRWFLAHPPMKEEQIKFCLTADMIGRSLAGIETPLVFALGSESCPLARQTLNQITIPEGLAVAPLGVDIIGVRSDYGPFRQRRIPFLFFSTGEHPDYHTPRDTFERIDFEKNAKVATVMGRVTLTMGNTPHDIAWQRTEEPDFAEVDSILKVTNHFLAADEAGTFQLSDLQRLFLTQVQRKATYILKERNISTEERLWLVRATQVMMLTLF